jgi:hypothetical protein
MTLRRLEILYEQREDAFVRLIHAWIDTRSEDANDDAYENLDTAANALTFIQKAIVAARHAGQR